MTNAQLMDVSKKDGLTNVAEWLETSNASADRTSAGVASFQSQFMSDPEPHDFVRELNSFAAGAESRGESPALWLSVLGTLTSHADTNGVIDVSA